MVNKFAGVQLPYTMIGEVPEYLSGIYILYHYKTRKTKECFYIGESDDIRTRLKEHMQKSSKRFDAFSYVRFHPSKRKFIEQFLIKALDHIPGEKMKVFIQNKVHEIDEPQFFNGSKENPRLEKVKM